ncbi:MAG: TlpA disulfide reductase family protein [Desulfobacterales bacterium]|nr:TlpA disulfide reductase family protein [Desulfobacterales bacterium]
MKPIERRHILKAILFLVLLISIQTNASAAVTVEKISEAALDELIYSGQKKKVITFMAAWCGPCIDELPTLNKLHQKYKARGLTLIGVSIDLEGPQAMQPIIDKLKVDFPVYWYGENAIQKYSVFAIPMLFWVQDGKIVEKLGGRRSEKELDKRIRQFLKR